MHNERLNYLRLKNSILLKDKILTYSKQKKFQQQFYSEDNFLPKSFKKTFLY